MIDTDWSQQSQQWWALHVRVARGESLAEEERSVYEAGLRQREQEEPLRADISSLQAARSSLAALEIEQTRLRKKRAELDAEIATLEASLNERTRRLLGV